MRVCKRILAGLVFLLSLVGLLLSGAAGAGVWVVKGPATDRAVRLFGRVDSALDVAESGLDHVQDSLARAAERLENVKEEQRKLAQEPRRSSALGRTLARTVQQRVAPEFSDAHQTLNSVAEAAVVVNSVLEDLGNFPFLSTSGLDLDRLREMNDRLADVGPAAWELSRLLGETDTEADAQVSRIERTLEAMRAMVGDYQTQVRQARQRADEVKARTLAWITPAAILISLVCFWIALSQISLMAHARSWWRRSGRAPTTAGPASATS
jgi:hypothetical protein